MSALLLLLASLPITSPQGAGSPRAAARSYFAAIARGDADAALALVSDPSDADRLVVRAEAGGEKALGALEHEAAARFGERGGLGVERRQARLLAAVDRARVEVKGDRAVLRPEGERPVRLRRVGGSWKVESPAERLTGEERKALDQGLRTSERAARDLGERIRSGALKSAREAREALRRALGRKEDEGVPL